MTETIRLEKTCDVMAEVCPRKATTIEQLFKLVAKRLLKVHNLQLRDGDFRAAIWINIDSNKMKLTVDFKKVYNKHAKSRRRYTR